MKQHIFAYRIISRDTKNSKSSHILKTNEKRRSVKIHKLFKIFDIIQQNKLKEKE